MNINCFNLTNDASDEFCTIMNLKWISGNLPKI